MPPLSLPRKEPLEPTSPWCYAPVWVWKTKNTQHAPPGKKKLPGLICWFLFIFRYKWTKYHKPWDFPLQMVIELVCALKLGNLLSFAAVWMLFSTQRQFSHFKAKKHTLVETLHLIKKKKKKQNRVLRSPKPRAPKYLHKCRFWFRWFVAFARFLIGFSRELSLELCSAVTRSDAGSGFSALLTNGKSGCRVDLVEASNRGVPLILSGSNLHQSPAWRSKVVRCIYCIFISFNPTNVAQAIVHRGNW